MRFSPRRAPLNISEKSYITQKSGVFPFVIMGLTNVRVIFRFLTFLYNQTLISYITSNIRPLSLTIPLLRIRSNTVRKKTRYLYFPLGQTIFFLIYNIVIRNANTLATTKPLTSPRTVIERVYHAMLCHHIASHVPQNYHRAGSRSDAV